MSRHRRGKTKLGIIIGAASLGCFALDTPAHAMPADIARCQPALTDVRVTNSNLLGLIKDLSTVQNDIGKVEHYLQIPLDLRDDIKKVDTTMHDIDEILTVLADLSDPVPDIAEPLNNIATAMNGIQQDVVAPIDTVVTDTVAVLQIEQTKRQLDVAKNHIGDIKKPISETQGYVSQVLTATNDMVNVVSAFPPGSCRAPIAQGVNAYCTGLDDVARPIANAENGVTQTVTRIENTIQHELLVIFKTFDAIQRDLNAVTRPIDAIYHELRVMERELKHRIDLKIAGVTVASFSIREILDDWNRVVKTVEHFIGLDKAKKWLRKEVEAVMRRPIKK